VSRRALALAALAGVLGACGAPTARLRVVVDGDGSTTPAAGTYTYDVGSTIRVTAQPASGAAFTRWTGAAEGIVNPVELLLDGDVTLVAHFSPGTAGGASAAARGEARPLGVTGSGAATRGK
jgi:hypothetical protein